MGMKRVYRLVHATARQRAIQDVQQAEEGWIVTVSPPTRSLEQNAALWPILQAMAEQIEWYGQSLTDEEWKDVLTAALKREKVVPGINGGFVVLGQRTSKMGKREFSDLLEFAHAFCADRGVRLWDEPAASRRLTKGVSPPSRVATCAACDATPVLSTVVTTSELGPEARAAPGRPGGSAGAE